MYSWPLSTKKVSNYAFIIAYRADNALATYRKVELSTLMHCDILVLVIVQSPTNPLGGSVSNFV